MARCIATSYSVHTLSQEAPSPLCANVRFSLSPLPPVRKYYVGGPPKNLSQIGESAVYFEFLFLANSNISIRALLYKCGSSSRGCISHNLYISLPRCLYYVKRYGIFNTEFYFAPCFFCEVIFRAYILSI